MVWTSARAPGLTRMRSASTSSMIVSGSPRSNPMRSRSAGSNAMSPFMARSVMAAMRDFSPTLSASSSTHSWPIMVESISATRSRLRQCANGRTTPIRARRAPGRRGSELCDQQALIDRRIGREANIRRDARREPAWFGAAQFAAHAGERGLIQRRRAGVRDQGCHMSHAQKDRRDAKRAVLIAGPTASGKSGLALALAEALGGVIVNADSMQVYRDLRILTARPSAEAEARVPHRLYGHVDAAETYSVGRWLRDVEPVLAEALRAGRLPILDGGTGLYFKALTTGLAAIPPVPAALRAGLRARLAAGGAPALHAELGECDPESAAKIRSQDGVRIARALEIFRAN